MFTFSNALIIVAERYGNEKDDAGVDIIKHFLHVYHKVKRKGGSNEAQMTAILHDAVEDGKITIEELEEMGCPESVIIALNLLDHKRDQQWVDERIDYYMKKDDNVPRPFANKKAKDEEYLNYVTRLSQNDIARMVKTEDLLHNSDIKRQPVNDMDAAYLGSRLVKYGKALRILTGGKVGYC